MHVVRKQAGWCNDWSIRSLSTTSVATKLERGGNFLHQCLAPGCSQRCRARQGMAEQGRLHQEKDNHIIPYRTERTWHLQWNILDSMTLNVFQSVTFLHLQKLQNIVQHWILRIWQIWITKYHMRLSWRLTLEIDR